MFIEYISQTVLIQMVVLGYIKMQSMNAIVKKPRNLYTHRNW